MRYASGEEFLAQPAKAVTVFGMSGVGKTTLGGLLQRHNWFQYSVDYRIGTRYMNEHIVDNFKREAMKVPLLRELLRSDSIYLRPNLSFENLKPLSTYLGQPGDPAKGGIAVQEYRRRQAQHRLAETRALLDVPEFIARALDIYGYRHVVCDAGGSLCEVVDVHNTDDPVLKCLTDHTMLVYIAGTDAHVKQLVDRFRRDPKPMYYAPDFFDAAWSGFKEYSGTRDDDAVDPAAFAVWGFEQLVRHRIPRYEALARQHGYTIRFDDVPGIQTEADFVSLLAKAIDAVAG